MVLKLLAYAFPYIADVPVEIEAQHSRLEMQSIEKVSS
jgi:hypothetical protein